MKNMMKLFTLCTLFIAVLVLASCEIDQNQHNHIDNNGDKICDICKIDLVLPTPVVTVDEDGLASWQAIENAANYIYKIGTTEMATMKTSIQLNDGDEIQVKAVAMNGFIDSEYSKAVTYTAKVDKVYGLPVALEGFYMRDADMLQDGDTRYLIYTTNKTKAEEDNVIALRTGIKETDGWVYAEQKVLLEASETGWDQYLGSASITKGEFTYGGETYSYLMAYQGSAMSNQTANQIGFAVAKTIDGTYVRVGNAPVVTYDAAQYGANMVGCYAPSIVNYNKAGGVRVFYTLADAFGHYAYFMDVDATNLDKVKGVKAMITNKGNLQSGDAVTMFPNADFAYDDVNKVFYAVKDFSPTPSTKPSFADEFELCHIQEEELYTTDEGNGWVSDVYKDYIDLDAERVYSGSIVTDMYGHMLTGNIVIIYNVCEIGNDYLYTQMFKEFTYVVAK